MAVCCIHMYANASASANLASGYLLKKRFFLATTDSHYNIPTTVLNNHHST